ncbi:MULTISPECIES: hypothetical protein [Citricoccus]|uniref:DUF2804 domain-containing protein n=1 Tax=Citricoccus parietis TaxID=592307 RepID=A0ABV6F0I8_9MICC|nr:hypothetical protein [Citricoccus sp. K5]VXC22049.1 conserved hypothetical protein [Citricoccus sp. K5]
MASDTLPADRSYEEFAEHFPLAPIDDHFVHQTPDPVRVMWTGDPRAYERHWVVIHDDTGDLTIATGGSFYPNLDRAEAYAIVNSKGRHTSVRSYRPIGADRDDLRVGPIVPVIVRGLREWRYILEPNEWGISYDLAFTDTTRQAFREPLSNSAAGTPPGRRNDVTSGFECFGTVSGWVEIDGERITLGPNAAGTRDRHWGTGRGVGGPRLSLGGRLHVGTNGNAFVAFPDWNLWGDRLFYPFGEDTVPWTTAHKPTRRLRFEPDTDIFTEGIVDYTFANGESAQLHYEKIGQQTLYLRCGMYGGTPDRDIHQGSYDGPAMTEGETYDVNRPETRIAIRGLDEHLCRVTRDDGTSVLGIYQTIDPVAFEVCTAGRKGWDFLS